VLAKSWEAVIGASYFVIPMMLIYLLLWMMLGVFLLLGQTPLFGDLFTTVLAFAPFLINLCTLILCLATLAALFFVSPVVALRGLNRTFVSQITARKLKADPFTNVFLAVVALLPILLSVGLLVLAALLTGSVFHDRNDHLVTVL